MKKVIKLLILIIIPLVAALITGLYGYNRYKDSFYRYYMDQASNTNTVDRLISHLKFSEEFLEYEKTEDGYDFFYDDEVTNEYGKLFDFSIIRSNYTIKDEPYTNDRGTVVGKKDAYYVTYHYVIYNVNYDLLAKTLDPSNEHKLEMEVVPAIEFRLVDKNDEEINMDFIMSTLNQATVETYNANVYDYGYSPEKDSNGKYLNGFNSQTNKPFPMLLKYYVMKDQALDSFGSEITMKINIKSMWDNEDGDDVSEEVKSIDFSNLLSHKLINKKDSAAKEEILNFKKVFNEDIYKAGYNKYAFGQYIWWECLIAIVLFEVVCAAFVIVWNAEEEETKKANMKK